MINSERETKKKKNKKRTGNRTAPTFRITPTIGLFRRVWAFIVDDEVCIL